MKLIFSRIQFFLFLFIIQSGVVFITVQSFLIQISGRDAWLIFIASSCILLLQFFLYEWNFKYFNIGKFLSLGYEVYYLIQNVMIIMTVTFVIKTWIFPTTPSILIVSAMILVSLYANVSRPETVINFGVILIPLIILFWIFLSLSSVDFVWTNLFPIGTSSLKQWGEGIIYSQIIFSGAEIYLFYRKFVNSPDEKMKLPLFFYWVLFTLFMLFSILATLLYFNMKELVLVPYPMLYILKAQHLTFVERLDLFFIYIWVMWSVICFTLFAFTKIYLHMQHSRRHKRTVTICCHILIAIIPLFLIDPEYATLPRYIIIPLYILFSIVIPVYVIVRERRKEKRNAKG